MDVQYRSRSFFPDHRGGTLPSSLLVGSDVLFHGQVLLNGRMGLLENNWDTGRLEVAGRVPRRHQLESLRHWRIRNARISSRRSHVLFLSFGHIRAPQRERGRKNEMEKRVHLTVCGRDVEVLGSLVISLGRKRT
jgi:hypothetical protein